MIEVAAAGFLVQQSHGRALDVKAAHGAAFGHGIPGGGIVLGLPSVFIKNDTVGLHIGDGVTDHRQAAVSQKVDLHQPGVLGAVLVPLDDGHPFGGRFHGNVAVDGIRGDDHTAGVHGEVPWNPDDPLGQCYDLRPGVDEIQVAGFRTLSQVVQQTGIQLPPMPEPGQAPGDPADFASGHAEHLGCFPQGHAGLEKDMAGDHGRMAGKTVEYAVDDRVPFVPGKIHVDVRRVASPGVEESAEIEVVLHRADIGDAQAVGHQ
jgi:hypothetical protein